MLVVTRRVGQSLVVDGRYVITLSKICDETIDARVRTVDDSPLDFVTLRKQVKREIVPHVSLAYISPLPDGRCRLGVESPKATHICRLENWSPQRGEVM